MGALADKENSHLKGLKLLNFRLFVRRQDILLLDWTTGSKSRCWWYPNVWWTSYMVEALDRGKLINPLGRQFYFILWLTWFQNHCFIRHLHFGSISHMSGISWLYYMKLSCVIPGYFSVIHSLLTFLLKKDNENILTAMDLLVKSSFVPSCQTNVKMWSIHDLFILKTVLFYQ